MKEKIVWIVAAILSAIAWGIHFYKFTSIDFSSGETTFLWVVDTWAALITNGLFIFPLALIVPFFLSRHQTFKVRFIKTLPIAIIIVYVLVIYALGSVVYFGYLPDK